MHPAATLVAQLPDESRFDVVVVGAGAAGLATAVTAGLSGSRTLLIEATRYIGGTSAYSAGTIWAPNTHHAKRMGAEDDLARATTYLDRAVGNRSSKSLRDAFLSTAPEAIAFLEETAGTCFRARPLHPDYLSEVEGSTTFGRALEPVPFDGRRLGDDFALVRPPIEEFTILGGMMVDRDDIASLLNLTKSRKSLLHATRIVSRYLVDRMKRPRGTRLVMGNALVGQLLLAARHAGVDIAIGAKVLEFVEDGSGITGLVVEQDGIRRKIDAAGGVVLATGGFAGNKDMRRERLPAAVPDFSPSAPGPRGELQRLALDIGAHFGEDASQPCFWAPCSVNTRSDGSLAVFPHFVFDRSKPGTLCVGRNGRRFVNESISYHQFGAAMLERDESGSIIPAFLIADAKAVERYGLGMVRPGARGLRAYLKSGYVVQGATLYELANRLGVDAANLQQTVAEMNGFARQGLDPEFGRGTTVYQRVNGDPAHKPNPTLGEIVEAPFYAVKLWPCDIGSAVGLVTDENGRVLRRDGTAIDGLYAAGNDMQSIMGGVYPGPGITLGPGLVFGYRTGRHAALRAGLQDPAAPPHHSIAGAIGRSGQAAERRRRPEGPGGH